MSSVVDIFKDLYTVHSTLLSPLAFIRIRISKGRPGRQPLEELPKVLVEGLTRHHLFGRFEHFEVAFGAKTMPKRPF